MLVRYQVLQFRGVAATIRRLSLRVNSTHESAQIYLKPYRSTYDGLTMLPFVIARAPGMTSQSCDLYIVRLMSSPIVGPNPIPLKSSLTVSRTRQAPTGQHTDSEYDLTMTECMGRGTRLRSRLYAISHGLLVTNNYIHNPSSAWYNMTPQPLNMKSITCPQFAHFHLHFAYCNVKNKKAELSQR